MNGAAREEWHLRISNTCLRRHRWLVICFFLCIAVFICGSEALETPTGIENLILERISIVSSKELHRTVKDLQDMGNRFTWEKQEEAAKYLKNRLEEYGTQVVFDEYFFKERKWKNVLARIPGKKKPEEIVMIISHLDSISGEPENSAPGADDNGSGTAALLEIAQVLSETRLEKTIEFVIFSNEEQGQAGSKHFARQAREEGLILGGVFNLDIIGYNEPNAFGPSDKRSLFASAKSAVKTGRNYIFKMLYPNGRIAIAGRPENRHLVEAASFHMKKYSKLSVSTQVGEDCG